MVRPEFRTADEWRVAAKVLLDRSPQALSLDRTQFAEQAITLGLLTVDDLRRGPAHVFGRADRNADDTGGSVRIQARGADLDDPRIGGGQECQPL